jgi:predicted RNase H-like nuclease
MIDPSQLEDVVGMSFPNRGQQTHAVLGVDGCRSGWVGVVLAPGRPVVGVLGATIATVVEAAGAAAGTLQAIGIDMPVHPPEAGHRQADVAARVHLGRKASSLFPTPARSVLDAPSYADACAAARALDGRAISRQAWALRPKILEVGAWLAAAPCPVYEVHPEVSFSLLTGAPIMAGKRSAAGLAARRQALLEAGIVAPTDLADARGVAADDVLDATVVAWSARRIAAGRARSFPDPPERLPDGRLDAIWA